MMIRHYQATARGDHPTLTPLHTIQQREQLISRGETMTVQSASTPIFVPAAPNYAASRPVEQQIRASSVSSDLEVTTPITLVDNGKDRWHYTATPGTPGVLTLQLQVSDQVT